MRALGRMAAYKRGLELAAGACAAVSFKSGSLPFQLDDLVSVDLGCALTSATLPVVFSVQVKSHIRWTLLPVLLGLTAQMALFIDMMFDSHLFAIDATVVHRFTLALTLLSSLLCTLFPVKSFNKSSGKYGVSFVETMWRDWYRTFRCSSIESNQVAKQQSGRGD